VTGLRSPSVLARWPGRTRSSAFSPQNSSIEQRRFFPGIPIIVR